MLPRPATQRQQQWRSRFLGMRLLRVPRWLMRKHLVNRQRGNLEQDKQREKKHAGLFSNSTYLPHDAHPLGQVPCRTPPANRISRTDYTTMRSHFQ